MVIMPIYLPECRQPLIFCWIVPNLRQSNVIAACLQNTAAWLLLRLALHSCEYKVEGSKQLQAE